MDESRLIHWMEAALSLAARAAANDEVPVGCVIVSNDELIAQGMNAREATLRTTAHAEIVALENYNAKFKTWRLPEGASIFVTAEPCMMCTGALLWGRATHIYFGCSDPKNAGLNHIKAGIESGKFDHKFQTIQGGILEKRSIAILKSYFKTKRTKNESP